MLIDNNTKRARSSNSFVSVIISWLGSKYVKITFEDDEVKCDVQEIRELLEKRKTHLEISPRLYDKLVSNDHA
jgi:hypothetical protein